MVTHFTNLDYRERVIGCNSPKPLPNCHIQYTSAFSYQQNNRCEGFSLKYVLAGLEQHHINGKRYGVEAGNYLVVGQGSDISIKIESKKLVEGVHFYLTEEIVSDVWRSLNNTPENLLENPKSTLETPAFFENKFGCKRDPLGSFMAQIGRSIQTNAFNEDMLDDSLFYWLALELCKQQSAHLINLEIIPAKKKSTREELYRRLITAREYIHDNFTQAVSIPELAQMANLSEFHFLRCFKVVFGDSPYQYLLNLRLQLGKYLLICGKLSITEIAFSLGFKEVQTFSKLFRKAFSKGPSNFIQLYKISNLM